MNECIYEENERRANLSRAEVLKELASFEIPPDDPFKCPFEYQSTNQWGSNMCHEPGCGMASDNYYCLITRQNPCCNKGTFTRDKFVIARKTLPPQSGWAYEQFQKMIRASERFDVGVSSETWLMCEMLCIIIEKQAERIDMLEKRLSLL